MSQIINSKSDEPEAQRAVIKLALNEIVAEVGVALHDSRIDFPIYLTVPNSGNSIATMVCPLDPSDSEWSLAASTVCRIIGQRLGDVRLCGRPLICAMANSTMDAVDVTADVGTET